MDVSCKIISMPTIKPIDEKIIFETARKFKNIITAAAITPINKKRLDLSIIHHSLLRLRDTINGL